MRCFQGKNGKNLNQAFILGNDVFRIKWRIQITDMLLNLVTAGFYDCINFVCQCLIGFAANEGLCRYLDFFTTIGKPFDRSGRLRNGLFVVIADMIQPLDIVGQDQQARGNFRAFFGKCGIHPLFADTLVQSLNARDDRFCQGNGFRLSHEGQAAADFCHMFAQGFHATRFGAFQPFDELPLDGGDVACHFILNTRQ